MILPQGNFNKGFEGIVMLSQVIHYVDAFIQTSEFLTSSERYWKEISTNSWHSTNIFEYIIVIYIYIYKNMILKTLNKQIMVH